MIYFDICGETNAKVSGFWTPAD